MCASCDELKECLVASLAPQSSPAQVEIPQTMLRYVAAFNDVPACARCGSAFDAHALERLGQLLTTAAVSSACALGVLPELIGDAPRASVSGASLALLFSAVKFHMGAALAFLDELQRDVDQIKGDSRSSESFLRLCAEMQCHIQLIRSVAIACDAESAQLSKVLQIPPVAPDLEKFCADMKALISIADSVRIGYLEKQSVGLNLVNLSQQMRNLRSTASKYIKIFDSLFNGVRKSFATSYLEKNFKLYQNNLMIISHYVGLFILIFADCMTLNPNKSVEFIDVLSNLSKVTFDLIFSSNKLMRFKCDFFQEKNRLRESYDKLNNLLASIKSLLYDNLILDNKVSKVFADFVFSSEFNNFSIILNGFSKKIDLMLISIQNDKRFILYEPLSIDFIASPITQNGEIFMKSLNNLLKLIENSDTTKEQFETGLSSVLSEHESFQKYLDDFIQKSGKSNEKRRILHLKDCLTIALNEFRLIFERYMNNPAEVYQKKNVYLFFHNLMLTFCYFDTNVFYLSNLETIVYNFNNTFKKFGEIHFEKIKKIIDDIDACNAAFSKVQIISKSNLIKSILEILNKVPDSSYELFTNLNILHILLACLFFTILDCENDDFLKSEQVSNLHSYLIYLFNFLKIFKKSVQIYLLRKSEIFLSLGTSCLLLLKELANHKSNDSYNKISTILPETAKILKGFESRVAEMRYGITIDNTEFLNILELINPIFPAIDKILDEIKNFTEIPYLANKLEKDIYNMKNVMKSFKIFDEFKPYFKNIKLVIPNNVYSGPLMVSFLSGINQEITQFLQLLRKNNKDYISVSALEICHRLSDCLVYVQMCDISSSSYQTLNSYFLQFAHSSAGITIGENKEQQKIIPIIETIIKGCNNLLKYSYQISNKFDKMIFQNGNISNAKLYSKPINYLTSIFACENISKQLTIINNVLSEQKKSDDINEKQIQKIEEENQILQEKEINKYLNKEKIPLDNKTNSESENESSLAQKELMKNIIHISMNFPPSCNEPDISFKFVDSLISISDENDEFISEISNFDDIPKCILTPPRNINDNSLYPFPNLTINSDCFKSDSSLSVTIPNEIKAEQIKSAPSFRDKQINNSIQDKLANDNAIQRSQSSNVNEAKIQNNSFGDDLTVQESKQPKKIQFLNLEKQNDKKIELPNPLKSNDFGQLSFPSNSSVQSDNASCAFPPQLKTSQKHPFSIFSDFEARKGISNIKPIQQPAKQNNISKFSLSQELNSDFETSGNIPPPMQSFKPKGFSSDSDSDFDSKDMMLINPPSKFIQKEVSKFSFPSELDSSQDGIPPPYTLDGFSNYQSDSELQTLDIDNIPPPISSNNISRFRYPSDSNSSELKSNNNLLLQNIKNQKSDSQSDDYISESLISSNNHLSNSSNNSYSSFQSNIDDNNMLSDNSDTYTDEPNSFHSNKLILPFQQSPSHTSKQFTNKNSQSPSLGYSSNGIDSLGFISQN